MEWILGKLSVGLLDGVMKSVVQPFLNVWLKSKDVDLEKFKTAQGNTTLLATAVLQGNIEFAKTKSQYAITVLQWWPFRTLLFILIAVSVTRFTLASFDSTWWWIFGCTIDGKHVIGDACSWSLPVIRGTFGEAEKEFLLFFIIAKPVDSLVQGGFAMVSKYMQKK